MHKLNMFKNSPKSDLSTVLRLERSIICLPSGAEYGKVKNFMFLVQEDMQSLY